MRLLGPGIAALGAFALGAPVNAGIDEAAHQKCLEAVDYKGCIETVQESTAVEIAPGIQVKNDSLTAALVRRAAEIPGCINEPYFLKYHHGYADSDLNDICKKVSQLKKDWSPGDSECNEPLSNYLWSMSVDLDLYAAETPNATYKQLEDQRPTFPESSQGSANASRCPRGTSMVTINKRWNFLFIRGGRVEEIGCMSPQQLAGFNAQIELNNREAARQSWRDAMNNMAADRRNRELIDALNKPVYCLSDSTTHGTLTDLGAYGGTTYGSTLCY